jgi:predicted transcriptional regulator
LKNKNEFTPKELAYSLDLYEIHRRENDPFINLVDLGYIEKLGNTHKYIITITGIEKVREILQNLKLKNINFYNEIIQQVKLIPYLDFKKQHEDLRQFLQNQIIAATDQWKRYLIHLFKIIEKKNQNEVKSKELADSLAVQSTSVFSQGAMQTLIKKNLVQEIKSQSSRPNSYILTDNGLIKASELLKEFGIK